MPRCPHSSRSYSTPDLTHAARDEEDAAPLLVPLVAVWAAPEEAEESTTERIADDEEGDAEEEEEEGLEQAADA